MKSSTAATPHHPAPDYATIRRAARLVGCGETRLRRATKIGEVALYQPEGSWPLVRLSDVRAWLDSCRVVPTARARQRVDEVLAREARRAG